MMLLFRRSISHTHTHIHGLAPSVLVPCSTPQRKCIAYYPYVSVLSALLAPLAHEKDTSDLSNCASPHTLDCTFPSHSTFTVRLTNHLRADNHSLVTGRACFVFFCEPCVLVSALASISRKEKCNSNSFIHWQHGHSA